MTACAECGTTNRPGRRFCAQCGSALARSCPTCAATSEPGDRFCGECGTSLEPSAAAPSATDGLAAPSVSERRLVSVLFADLVGFTTLSENRDPETVRELLSEYFDRCRTVIERHGGTVEKFIGDAVMAVWGAPVAREDDAERAVRAALSLTQAVDALGREVGMPALRVRVGVLTGSAAVEFGGQGEGMVLGGDAVNTASRLQSIAPPGGVLVEDVTRRVSEAAIAYEDAGMHQVKGREQPVHAYRALRVVAGVGGARRGAGLEAPLVGRQAEVEVIVAAAERCWSAERAELVCVLGDAGAGKSRLLWEFFKHLDGIRRVVMWHQGRSLSYGEAAGYGALADMVRQRAEIVEHEDPETARAKLRATVERYVSAERERRLIEPRLAHLLGLEQRIAPDRADLFSGWRMFFERLAATDPVALVFEDLQWADSGLLDFIDHLLEWSGDSAIFILALGRSELRGARPGWVPTVELEPLPDAAMRELLAGLVPGLPEALTERIRARADGLPLYAVETVRMLLDRGLLASDGSRYVVTGDVVDLDVPETLQALTASRLDGLQAPERALVQHAAVLGQSFTVAAAAALAERPPAEVERVLDVLVAKQILRRIDDARSPERGHYEFLQGLLRSVAYGTLGRRVRKQRHLAAARHLQQSWAGETSEIAEVLAAHYLDAVRADPGAPDADEIRVAGRETLAAAGRRAVSLALGGEAQRAFDQAAELAEDEGTRAELLEEAGRAAWMTADADAARERLDAAIALHEGAGRLQAAARARITVVETFIKTGRVEEALALSGRLYADLDEDGRDRAVAATQLAWVQIMAARYDDALASADAALEIAEPLQDWPALTEGLLVRGVAGHRLGRYQEHLALTAHALTLALHHDLPISALRAHFNLAGGALHDDRFADALEHIAWGLEIAQARGDRVWARMLLSQAVYPLAVLGRWDEATANAQGLFADEADDLALLYTLPPLAMVQAACGDRVSLQATLERATGSTHVASEPEVSLLVRAICAHTFGHPAEALDLARQVASGEASVSVEDREMAVYVAGEAALALGDRGAVCALVTSTRTQAPALLTPSMRAQLARLSALLAAVDGDRELAARHFETAAASLRDLGCRFLLAQVLVEHGELLGAAAGEALLRQGREILEELGAQPWLDRIDRALGGVAA